MTLPPPTNLPPLHDFHFLPQAQPFNSHHCIHFSPPARRSICGPHYFTPLASLVKPNNRGGFSGLMACKAPWVSRIYQYLLLFLMANGARCITPLTSDVCSGGSQWHWRAEIQILYSVPRYYWCQWRDAVTVNVYIVTSFRVWTVYSVYSPTFPSVWTCVWSILPLPIIRHWSMCASYIYCNRTFQSMV